ncbi:MAG: hypothetical protein RL754_747 [Bacteroidota bacterium]|jgi:F-type H+-transporting ATPase subunit delta
MNYPRVASRYSKALLELAIEQNSLDQVNDNASALIAAIQGSRDLELLLKSPVVKADKKQNILKAIFTDSFTPLFEGFVMLLTKNGRERHLAEICEKFQKDVLVHKGIVEAHVLTAVALTESAKESLVSKLKSQLNKEVVLVESVDAAAIGGMKLRVEGYELDGTIAGKLRSLKHGLVDKSYESKY